MQEKYTDNEKKFFECFMDIESAFDKVHRKVMKWAMRKKDFPEVMVRAVMSLLSCSKLLAVFNVNFSFLSLQYEILN